MLRIVVSSTHDVPGRVPRARGVSTSFRPETHSQIGSRDAWKLLAAILPFLGRGDEDYEWAERLADQEKLDEWRDQTRGSYFCLSFVSLILKYCYAVATMRTWHSLGYDVLAAAKWWPQCWGAKWRCVAGFTLLDVNEARDIAVEARDCSTLTKELLCARLTSIGVDVNARGVHGILERCRFIGRVEIGGYDNMAVHNTLIELHKELWDSNVKMDKSTLSNMLTPNRFLETSMSSYGGVCQVGRYSFELMQYTIRCRHVITGFETTFEFTLLWDGGISELVRECLSRTGDRICDFWRTLSEQRKNWEAGTLKATFSNSHQSIRLVSSARKWAVLAKDAFVGSTTDLPESVYLDRSGDDIRLCDPAWRARLESKASKTRKHGCSRSTAEATPNKRRG